MDAATLPDLDQLDSQERKTLVLALHEQVFSNQKQLTTQQKEIVSQREQLASRDAEIEHLKLLIAKLRRMKFGRSSEKRKAQIEQLELRLEELEIRRRKETAAVGPSMPASIAAARPVRRPLPNHLPREVRKCLPEQEACPDCGGKLKHLGKTKTGRLWTYVRDDRPAGDSTPAAVWFAYSPDRKGEHPQTHLQNFTGTLQADGYAGFDQVYTTGSRKLRAGRMC